MKKIFQIVGIITLLMGSFMYNNKVAMTSKLSDDLLDEIKDKSTMYETSPKEAILDGKTIIPGVSGKRVNIKKSYKEMKEIGYFNDKLLVYEKIPVKESVKRNTDKYVIGGNRELKQIFLLFKVGSNDNINNIVKILDEENIKGNFFITGSFLENNYNLISNLLKKGHIIGNLSDNENYTDSDFSWIKNVLITSKYQKYNYCYTEKPNDEILNICNLQKSYTIMPITIYGDPFIFVKNNLSSGQILSFKINDEINKELLNIINYINSKGYTIISFEKMIDAGI